MESKETKPIKKKTEPEIRNQQFHKKQINKV